MKNNRLPDIARLFDSRNFNIIFSLLVGLISWVFVVTTIDTAYDGVVEDVPVNFSVDEVSVRSQGLSIIGSPEATVDIYVTGDRTLVGALRPSDFNVTVRYDYITGPGSYQLPISVSKADSYADFSILSVTPSEAEIRVDIIESKTLAIEVDVQSIAVEEGYILGLPSVTPTEIVIQGSASEVQRIAHAVVEYEEGSVPLSERTISEGDIILYDVDGQEVNSADITMGIDTAEISIPVLKTGQMNTKFEYINIPDGFDIDSLRYTINPQVIDVAADEVSISKAGDLLIGYIDLKTFELGASYSFDITLPSGFTNLDNVSKATVTFDTSNMSQTTVTVNDFRIKNPVQGVDLEVATDQIVDVKLIGDTDTLETLQSESVIAEIDYANVSTTQGLQEVPVKIQIPSADDVFAIGEYTAIIEVK